VSTFQKKFFAVFSANAKQMQTKTYKLHVHEDCTSIDAKFTSIQQAVHAKITKNSSEFQKKFSVVRVVARGPSEHPSTSTGAYNSPESNPLYLEVHDGGDKMFALFGVASKAWTSLTENACFAWAQAWRT